MLYLLDTCVVSDIVKGIDNTLYKIKSISPSDLAISTITLAEIEYGLRKSLLIAQKIKKIIEIFLSTITILPFDSNAAIFSGQIRADLSTRGTPIGAYDVLIAGTALANSLTLVTSNIKEFQRINMLNVENWR